MQSTVCFSDQTIKVTIDDNGIVHMDIPTGETSFQMAFPVSQLIKNMAACTVALDDWHRRSKARVIPFGQDLAESA